jgi:hypothetical protein
MQTGGIRLTHLKGRIAARAPAESKTGAFINAKDFLARSSSVPYSSPNPIVSSVLQANVLCRMHNLEDSTAWGGTFLYPKESPINFTPLRPIDFKLPRALDRGVREIPWESNNDILSARLIRPEFSSECAGTPRREYQGGMVDGIRVRPIANPYFAPSGQVLKQFDRWRSRHWERWNPLNAAVRGGTRLYSIPKDILPKKDELGEWRPPSLGGRYQADVKRQYTIHGLPWIYRRDFARTKVHILDKEPIGPKRWYKREYRQAKIREAMRDMDAIVADYRREAQAAKKKTWFEQIIQKLVGTQLSSKYISDRKLPKI